MMKVGTNDFLSSNARSEYLSSVHDSLPEMISPTCIKKTLGLYRLCFSTYSCTLAISLLPYGTSPKAEKVTGCPCAQIKFDDNKTATIVL